MVVGGVTYRETHLFFFSLSLSLTLVRFFFSSGGESLSLLLAALPPATHTHTVDTVSGLSLQTRVRSDVSFSVSS